MTPPAKPTLETIAGLYEAAHSQMTSAAIAVERIVKDAAIHGVSEYQITAYLSRKEPNVIISDASSQPTNLKP